MTSSDLRIFQDFDDDQGGILLVEDFPQQEVLIFEIYSPPWGAWADKKIHDLTEGLKDLIFEIYSVLKNHHPIKRVLTEEEKSLISM